MRMEITTEGNVSTPPDRFMLKQVVAKFLNVNTHPVNAKVEENNIVRIVFHRVDDNILLYNFYFLCIIKSTCIIVVSKPVCVHCIFVHA